MATPDQTDGHPVILDTDAPQYATDLTGVSEYAADVGTRLIRANLAGLQAYPYPRVGLRGYAADTGIEYTYTANGWVSQNVQRPVVLRGIITTGAPATVRVVFPAGSFAAPPRVAVTPQNNGTVLVPHVTALDQNGFDIRLFSLTAAQIAGTVSWTAVEQ